MVLAVYSRKKEHARCLPRSDKSLCLCYGASLDRRREGRGREGGRGGKELVAKNQKNGKLQRRTDDGQEETGERDRGRTTMVHLKHGVIHPLAHSFIHPSVHSAIPTCPHNGAFALLTVRLVHTRTTDRSENDERRNQISQFRIHVLPMSCPRPAHVLSPTIVIIISQGESVEEMATMVGFVYVYYGKMCEC